MAKNFGKILLGLTAAGAAGAGAYYWLKNRHNEEPEDEFDDTFEEDAASFQFAFKVLLSFM